MQILIRVILGEIPASATIYGLNTCFWGYLPGKNMSLQKPGVGSSQSGQSIHPPKISINSGSSIIRNKSKFQQINGKIAVFLLQKK